MSRSIFSTVTLIVIYVLCIWGLMEVQNYGRQNGWYTTGDLQRCGFIFPLSCGVGAVGVILLGWYWFRLAGIITSIAKPLKDDGELSFRTAKDFLIPFRLKKIAEFFELTNKRLKDCADRIVKYENQIKELQIQLQLSQRRGHNTEAIIYSIRDAVIVIDEFDKVLMANESAGSLFDFDYRESQYKTIGELICTDQKDFLDFLSHSRKSKNQATRREIELSKDGIPKTFDCIVSCVYDHNQQICGAVAVLHDITREKEISKLKDDFVSHVSHELKTPLASITAYSEMLADGEANDEQTRKEFYSVIQNQAKRLNRLIEDILNISRIESGLIKINKELISLTILIEEQLQMIKSYAEEKNIKIVGQKPIVFDRVHADKDMISQVIVNLLSNAVKYTPEGGAVKIETEVDDIAALVRVNVTDTGVGIPEDEIEHVFDKYYRVGANNKQAKGTGLGLNLVKQIIENVHNGRVFVKSKVGMGSTFGFEMPLATKQTATAT